MTGPPDNGPPGLVEHGAGESNHVGTIGRGVAAVKDRLPPHSVKAEQALLGCLLIAPRESLDACQQANVTEFSFYDLRHQIIYAAFLDMMKAGVDKPDLVTLGERLKDAGKLEQIGSYAYLQSLLDGTPSAANIAYYLAIVREKALLRCLIANCTNAIDLAYGTRDDPEDVAEILASYKRDAEELPDRNGKVRTFTLWKPSQFLAWTEPPGIHLLLPAYLTRGELTVLIGQGGLGKSRLALTLAICQILKREWCGVNTGGEPQKWMILGTENSIGRLKGDLELMLATLTATERKAVDDLLRLQAVLDFTEGVCLDDPAAVKRLEGTLTQGKPGGLVLDPLVDFAPDDLSKPENMREAVRLILGIVHRNAPKATTLLLQHARPGKQNIRMAVGYDAPAFGSGGKGLFTSARCVLNVAPASETDPNRLLLSCAKSNNCVRFETRGLVLDPATRFYGVDPNFDLDGWRTDLASKGDAQKRRVTDEQVCALCDGAASKAALMKRIMGETGCQKTAAYEAIERAETRRLICYSKATKTYVRQ